MNNFVTQAWGNVYLDDRFAQVAEIKEFKDLRYKSQLGFSVISKEIEAKHKRYEHSLGVFHLSGLFFEQLKDKQYDKKIPNFERIVLAYRLACLVHDVGHYIFSHSFEEEFIKSHEDRTVEIVEKYRDFFNKIFGFDITTMVVQMFKTTKRDLVTPNWLHVLMPILSSSIDLDRIEYINSDSLAVNNVKADYSKLIQHLDFVEINSQIRGVLDIDGIELAKGLLERRFEQHINIYYEPECIYRDILIIKIKELQFSNYCSQEKEKIYNSFSEESFLNYLKKFSYSKEDSEIRRISKLFLEGPDEDIIFKGFTDFDAFELFKRENSSYEILVDKRKITQYSSVYPDAKKIFVRDKRGNINEISYYYPELEKIYQIVYVFVDKNQKFNVG